MPGSFPIVVLISGNGSNLQAIIDQCHNNNDSPVDIRAVICNRPQAYGLTRARGAGIPTLVVGAKTGQSREDYDQDLQQAIDQFQPELVVLAGFMRILSENFVNHYEKRLINIHPSLLPEFRGLNTHQRALDAGVTQHGATVHYVCYELDSGPSIIQAKVNIEKSDDSESLARRVYEKEHIIYPLVINWIAQGRIRTDNHNVLLDGARLTKPLQYPVELDNHPQA